MFFTNKQIGRLFNTLGPRLWDNKGKKLIYILNIYPLDSGE